MVSCNLQYVGTMVILPWCSRNIYIYIITFSGLGLKGSSSTRVMMFGWKGVCATLISSGLLLALNRHFKEPTEVRCSRWTSVFVCIIFYRDGEQVKTGVYDTFVFHGTVEQPFVHYVC